METDSLMAVQAVANVQGFLQGILPGLNEQAAIYVAKLLCGVPIMALIFANEWIGKKLAEASPLISAYLSPLWSRFKFMVNIALGAVLGGLSGDSTLGMAAAAAWGMFKGGAQVMTGKDLSKVTKAKAIVALVALSLCATSAMAQEATPLIPKPQANLLQQSTFAIGTGFERGFDSGEPYLGFMDAQLGMSWNHLAPRVRLVP